MGKRPALTEEGEGDEGAPLGRWDEAGGGRKGDEGFMRCEFL